MPPQTLLKLLAITTLAVTLAGCASTRPRPYSGVASSPLMQADPQGESSQTPYSYAPRTDWKAYSGAIIEPVTIYNGADAQFENVDEEDKRQLAQSMYSEFRAALGPHYPIASGKGPGILRVHLTLAGAKRNKAVVSTITKFDLAGMPYNTVQAIRGKQGLLAGSVSYAVEIHDSVSGELLLAYVSKQYPNAMNVMASMGALAAAKAGIRKGAQDLVDRMQ